VFNLAHENNVTIILPSVLYSLSLESLDELDESKPIIDHPSMPSSRLHVDHINIYSRMQRFRVEHVLSLCQPRSSFSLLCADKCWDKPNDIAYDIFGPCTMDTDFLHSTLKGIQTLKYRMPADRRPCETCKFGYWKYLETVRLKFWKGLPQVLDFGDWDALKKDNGIKM
jgi:hypothetical protein